MTANELYAVLAKIIADGDGDREVAAQQRDGQIVWLLSGPIVEPEWIGNGE